MSEARSIVRDGRMYALAQVVNRAAGLALIPVFTHVLSAAEFGVYAIVLSVSDLLSILLGLGFTGAMTRFYVDHPDDEAARRRVVSTLLLLVSAVGAGVLALSAPIGLLLSRLMFGADEQATLFALAVVGLVFIMLFELQCAYAVACKKVRMFFVLSCVKAAGLIAMNVLLVVVQRRGVAGVVLANAMALGTISLVTLVIVLRRTGLQFSAPLARQMLRFGLPLVPSALAHTALGVVERYALNSLAGAAAVGLYSLANRLASVLQMLIAAPFSQTYAVRRLESLVRGDDQAVYDRILLLFVLLISLSSVALALFATDLIALLAPSEYARAAQLIPLLGLSFVLASINFNLELGIQFTKRTWTLPVIGALALAVSVPLNYWFALRYGALGTALAVVLVNLVRIAVTAAMNWRFGAHSIRLDWLRCTVILVSTLVAGQIWVELETPALHPAWIAGKVVLLVLFAAALYASPLVGTAARAELGGIRRRATRAPT